MGRACSTEPGVLANFKYYLGVFEVSVTRGTVDDVLDVVVEVSAGSATGRSSAEAMFCVVVEEDAIMWGLICLPPLLSTTTTLVRFV